MKLTGIKEMNRALSRLPDEMKRSGETAVLRAGAKPILKSAKGRVAIESGLLKKSLGTNVKKVRGQTTARIGARKGRGKEVERDGVTVFSDPTKYSHLVEYGTSHSSAKPFMRPAAESAGNEIVAAMAEGYEKYLHRAAKRIKSRL